MADANQYKYIRDLLHGDNDFSESKLKTIIHHFPGGDVETRVESEGNFVANDIKRVSHSVAMVGGKTYKLLASSWLYQNFLSCYKNIFCHFSS